MPTSQSIKKLKGKVFLPSSCLFLYLNYRHSPLSLFFGHLSDNDSYVNAVTGFQAGRRDHFRPFLRFDKLTVPRKIEGWPVNVKTLTLFLIEAKSGSA